MHPNINLSLLDFIKNLEKNLKLSRCDINTIIIRCKIADNSHLNNDKCHALVHNLNGTIYQCTRKKKFGCFCGLHHNRKNDFKTIHQNKSYDESVYKISTKDMIEKDSDKSTNLYKVSHNYNEYFIDSNSGYFKIATSSKP